MKTMPDIKTKVVKSRTVKTLKGTIKTFDRSFQSADEIKKVSLNSSENLAPDNAPADVLQKGGFYAAQKAAGLTTKTSSALLRSPFRSYRAVSKSLEAKAKARESIKMAQKTIKDSKDTVKQSVKSVKSTYKASRSAIRIEHRVAKSAQDTVKAARTSAKSIKATTKTSAEAARKATQAAKVTAKATATVVKATIKATIVTAKAFAAVIKELIAAIAAGGWVALIIILILIVVIVLCSCFAVFLTNENEDKNLTMPIVVQNIDAEYANRIGNIIAENSTDNVELSGSRAVWNDVLAIYAVKVNYDNANPQEVATLDEYKIDILTEIFWEMNMISYKKETKSITVITETDDGYGNIIQTETQEEQSFLYITCSHKTAGEIALEYGFSPDQNDALTALLSPENAEMWATLIYGTFNSSNISDVAKTQIGNLNGETYWSWYGFNSRVEWCACFVSWCADQCGYIDMGIIPKYASCSAGIEWFKTRGLWKDKFYIPQKGDIIFFDWANGSGAYDGVSDHTGIVESVDNEYIYTIEGNSSNMVRRNKYRIGSPDIYGYGVPSY